MKTLSFPKCPKCADGGNVQLAQVTTDANSVFKPLPEGWQGETVPTFECECGWTKKAEEGELQPTM